MPCEFQISLLLVPMHVIKRSVARIDDSPFFATELDLTGVPRNCRLLLSGEPHSDAGIIFDDLMIINGHRYEPGFQPPSDAEQHVGGTPVGVYGPVNAIDITERRQPDHNLLRIAFYDRFVEGGYYCCSAIYLRVLCP